MAGYGMTDPKAAAAINALAAKNNAANKTVAVKPTHTTQAAAAKTNANVNYVNNAAKYMPSVNPKAQTGAKTVTNQDPNNNSAKMAMLAWGKNYMPAASPGAQATGSAANNFQAQVNKLGIGTGTGALWDYFEKNAGGGGSSGGGSSLSSWLGGGSSSGGLGALGGMMGGGGLGGMGGMGGLGSLGSMFGGGGMGGMGGIGDALGGALGGGSGGTPAEEEKEKDKPIPQRHWAGAYNSTQQAAMDDAKTNSERARLKAGFDQKNIADFKGQESYDEVQKQRVSQAQQLAERQGGAYDTEGNFYSKEAAKNATTEDKKKRAQLAANYYDVPDGAVPIAGNENDKTPPGSTPAAGSGSKDKDKGSKGSSLSSDWLKKLGGMAASWFGGG